VTLASREEVLDPERLMRVLEGATALHAVPSLMREVVELVRGGRPLPALRIAFVGGDRVPPELLRDMREAFPAAEIRVLYGPTEGTIICASHDVPRSGSVEGAMIGRPLGSAVLRLHDRYGNLVPEGIAGELRLGGPGVARGYLGREDATGERFLTRDGERFYRTGDRARRLPDGALEFLGRTDRQVKVRGFRVEPGEVEAVLSACPGVRECVVAAREDAPGETRLVGYVVPGEDAPPAEAVRSFLRERLPGHMVPSAFVVLERLPLTPNGKVDRGALPPPDGVRPGEGAGYEAPRTGAEESLARIWGEVLGAGRVGVHDNFFALGGDSILSIRVVSRAREAGLLLTPRDLFERQTLGAVAEAAGRATVEAPEPSVVTGPVPLTPVQHHFFAQGRPEPHHFNQAMLLEVGERLDAEILSGAVAALLEHHDALRLRFRREGGAWTQRCDAPGGEVPFQRLDLAALPDGGLREEIERAAAGRQTSLELEHGPLLRVVLFDCGAERPQRLLWVVHHLAVDAVSWGVLLEDLESAYRQLARGEAARLPGKTTSLRRWAERLQDHARSEALKAELPFWTEQTRATAPLPVDLVGGENLAAARTVVATLGEEETRALLTEVPGAYRTQVNDVLLCALAQAFREGTWERSLRIHLEVHGREERFADVDLSLTVGWFTSL
ncbi:MAG TPA: condensation domain-containing protein, partial [Longimicrobiaceae bacterium]|nr:condensation domain-containing protein [Longimicrobiaceae bacterium]